MNYGELRDEKRNASSGTMHTVSTARERRLSPDLMRQEEIPDPDAEEGMLGGINCRAGDPTGQSLHLPLGGDSLQLARSSSAQAE